MARKITAWRIPDGCIYESQREALIEEARNELPPLVEVTDMEELVGNPDEIDRALKALRIFKRASKA